MKSSLDIMSYEEFLQLPVNFIVRQAQNIKFKRENNIPLSEEETELRDHFIAYSNQVFLEETRARLEYCWSLDFNK